MPDIRLATFKAGAGGHGSGIRVGLAVWWSKVKEGSGRGLVLGWISPQKTCAHASKGICLEEVVLKLPANGAKTLSVPKSVTYVAI